MTEPPKDGPARNSLNRAIFDGAEQVRRQHDRRSRSRSSTSSGKSRSSWDRAEPCGGEPGPGDLRTDFLLVVQGIRRPEDQSGQSAQGARSGERTPRACSRRACLGRPNRPEPLEASRKVHDSARGKSSRRASNAPYLSPYRPDAKANAPETAFTLIPLNHARATFSTDC